MTRAVPATPLVDSIRFDSEFENEDDKENL